MLLELVSSLEQAHLEIKLDLRRFGSLRNTHELRDKPIIVVRMIITSQVTIKHYFKFESRNKFQNKIDSVPV